MSMSLDDALDAIAVCECGELNEACEKAGFGTPHPEGWWAVVTDESGGAEAYFTTQRRALEYRLFRINQLCNPPPIAKAWVRAYDEALNLAEKVPTGDDYNAVVREVLG